MVTTFVCSVQAEGGRGLLSGGFCPRGASVRGAFVREGLCPGAYVRSPISTVCSNLSQAAFRRKLGGGMLVRTGSHGSCVGRKVPEISRMELFSWASTKSVWADLNQTGQQHYIRYIGTIRTCRYWHKPTAEAVV